MSTVLIQMMKIQRSFKLQTNDCAMSLWPEQLSEHSRYEVFITTFNVNEFQKLNQ